MSSLQTDAEPNEGGSPVDKNSQESFQTQTISGEKTEVKNKAEGFVSTGPSVERQPQTTQPSSFTHSVNFDPNTTAQLHAITETNKRYKAVKNVFNIKAANIKTATIGATGPVNLETTHTKYKDGSKKQNYDISGGTYVQSNIGGSSTHENTGSTITAGSGGTVEGATLDIPDYPPYSPEQVLLRLLQTGIESKDLIDLLEKDYQVENLAFALPKSNPEKRNAIVNALMANDSQMEVEQS